MLFNKSLFATVSAAMFIGTASTFDGTAFLATTGFNSCGCTIKSDTLAVAVPSALVGSHVCCISTFLARTSGSFLPPTISRHSRRFKLVPLEANSVQQKVILTGIFDGGAGTQNIALSRSAFAASGGSPGETSLSSVVWAWN